MTPSPPNVTAMLRDWSNGDRKAQEQLFEETAEVLEISDSTVKRDWQMAKAWLHRELTR